MNWEDYNLQSRMLAFTLLGFFTSTIIFSILENEINPHTFEKPSVNQYWVNPLPSISTASIGTPSPSFGLGEPGGNYYE